MYHRVGFHSLIVLGPQYLDEENHVAEPVHLGTEVLVSELVGLCEERLAVDFLLKKVVFDRLEEEKVVLDPPDPG